jgi:cephalosporin hydroxylase
VPAILPAAYRDAYAKTLAEYLWDYYHVKASIHSVSWMGIPVYKSIHDLWVYQEILHAVRPGVVVEIGSLFGGSTLYLAHLLDALGGGKVVSVDLSRDRYQARHPRIVTVTGDCSSPEVVAAVRRECAAGPVLVIHDGDHREEAVLRDLRLYAPLVTPGSYCVVEDGVLELFNPARAGHAIPPGPLSAVGRFLAEPAGAAFEAAPECERFLLSSNPKGFLRRVR